MKTYKELLAEISMGSRRPKFASSMGRSMGRDEEPTREEREANIEKLTAKIADPKEGAAFKAVYQRQIDAHKKALKEDLDEATIKVLPGHPYHNKTKAELEYIVKDAGEAARNMKGHDPKAEAKYSDQMNDASTILYARKKSGSNQG